MQQPLVASYKDKRSATVIPSVAASAQAPPLVRD